LWTETPGEIAQLVCEQDPERPSTVVTRAARPGNGPTDLTAEEVSRLRETTTERLSRTLSGDLDAIVMKAMRKEPQRRYASAAQLAEDIGRHLTGLPVTAHSDALSYRAGKFIRRHRVGVASGVLVALSLLGGIIGTVYQAHVANAERAIAGRRFNDLRKLANSFLFEFHDAIQNLPGSTPARELVVRKALEYLDNLARESGKDQGLALELAEAYRKVGDVQGNPLNPNLGNTAGAQESFQKGLQILERLAAQDPGSLPARRSLAVMHQKLADTNSFTGNLQGAVDHNRKALALLEAIVKEAPEPASRRSLATLCLKVGDVLGNPGYPNLGDREGALRQYEAADAILAALSAPGRRAGATAAVGHSGADRYRAGVGRETG
jgi:non-specific serine/threonine protein kinase/serine/threonine-protein kinase